MPSSKKLANAFTSAQRLQVLCQTTTGLHAYQRIATLAVEVCASATPDSRRKVAALAVYAAKRTDALVNNGAGIPLSTERRQALDKFESTLELIRRHIESVPERGTKLPKFELAALTFFHHSRRLEAELDRVYHSLTTKARSASRNEYVLEVATLSTRAASAICEIPLPRLSFLKPVVGMAALICDTAKTVNGNRAAALALARHAQDVTNSVVERARKVSPAEGQNCNAESTTPLVLVLEESHAFLKRLKSRRRAASWILAGKDKERFAELNAALDRALAVFCGSQSIAIAAGVRGNTQDLAALVAAVHRVEDGVKGTMAVVHSNRATNTALVPETTAFVPILSHQFPISFFSFFF